MSTRRSDFDRKHIRRRWFAATLCGLFLIGPALSTVALTQDEKEKGAQAPPGTLENKQREQDAADAGENVGAQTEPEKTDRIPAFDDSDEAIARANEIFRTSVNAYHAAPAIRDTARVTSVSTYAGSTDEQSFEVPMLLTPESMKIKLNAVTFTVVDGTIYGENEQEPKRLYVQDFSGPVSAELFVDVLYIFPFAHVPMIFSDDPLNDLFVATIEPTIAGYRRVYLAEPDREFDEILIKSADDGADVTLRFDPDTSLIARFHTALRDPNMNETDGTEISVDFNANVLDLAPIEELVVNTDKRRMVDSFMGLYAPPNVMDLIGKPSPGFNLPNLDGERVNSDSMVGNVIVLAFWQIQHEGLLPILPALQQLVEWRDEEGKSLKIVAVDAGDQLDELRTYWNDHEYDMTLLRDEDFSAVNEDYRIPAFPTVVIIAADGTVHAVHPDFDFGVDIAEILKKDIESAFGRDI